MQIECVLRRKGGTVVDLPLGSRSISYHFAPPADDPSGPHTAEVAESSHLGTFLAIKEAYRIAKGGVNPGTVDVDDEDDLLEVEAGETLTFVCIKNGHAVLSTLLAMGLQLTDQSIVGPAKKPVAAEKPVAAPRVPKAAPAGAEKRSLPQAAAPAAVVAPEKPWHEGMSDEDLSAKVKEVTGGRSPKEGTPREAMIAAIDAASAAS